MWLHKGWQDFANFYSLDQGYFALFTYEGEHSHFLVRLFHWNDMEIDYPIHGGGMCVCVFVSFHLELLSGFSCVMDMICVEIDHWN